MYQLQKEHQLYSVRKKPYRVCTTDSNHTLSKAPNLLNQQFQIERPHAVWVTDITEFKSSCGKLYLAMIKDIFHKEIVGWALAEHMRTELCLEALKNAISKIKSERLHHRIYKNITEDRKDIFWYIECFYNRQRRHAAIGNQTPADYLKQYDVKQKNAA